MKTINFIDYLNKRDIKNIITLMGFRFIEETDEEIPEESRKSMAKKPITKLSDSDGEEYLMVMCKTMTKEEIDTIKVNLPMNKALIAFSTIVSCALSSDNKYGIFSYDDYKFLIIKNFYSYEGMFVGSEEAEMETARKLTDISTKYMETKFGKFYTEQRNKYIKKIKAEYKKEQEVKQQDNEEQELVETK